MSFFNPFAIGFVLVAGGVVVGMDYVIQSKAAGSQPGTYSFSTYLDNYGIRADDTVDMIDKTRRQAVEARTHLPMEPEGWTRTEWDIGAVDLDALTAGMDLVNKMAVKNEWRKGIKLANYEAWEYRKGDQVVRISASFDEEREPSETAIAGQLSATFHPIEDVKYSPARVIGNVPFLAVNDALAPRSVSHILLEARLGDEILIAVAADANPQQLDALLEQIDFDSLNKMLPEPLPYVGADAPELSTSQQMALSILEAQAMNSGQAVKAEDIATVLAGGTVEHSVVEEPEVQQAEAAPEPAPEPKKIKSSVGRLQLSGGRTCLSETSRLCD